MLSAMIVRPGVDSNRVVEMGSLRVELYAKKIVNPIQTAVKRPSSQVDKKMRQVEGLSSDGFVTSAESRVSVESVSGISTEDIER
jgi:hypothetical protein